MLFWHKQAEKKLQVLTLPGYVLYFLTALYFRISIWIFCNLFICLVFDGLQWICFRILIISQICTLFQPIKLQIFCILTININISFKLISVNFSSSSRSKFLIFSQQNFCARKIISFHSKAEKATSCRT